MCQTKSPEPCLRLLGIALEPVGERGVFRPLSQSGLHADAEQRRTHPSGPRAHHAGRSPSADRCEHLPTFHRRAGRTAEAVACTSSAQDESRRPKTRRPSPSSRAEVSLSFQRRGSSRQVGVPVPSRCHAQTRDRADREWPHPSSGTRRKCRSPWRRVDVDRAPIRRVHGRASMPGPTSVSFEPGRITKS